MAFALRPRHLPPKGLLRRCRLISHRGEHNGRDVLENTVAAFENAVSAGVWGIEFDVRWTRDLHPVVIHDPDLSRVFGLNIRVREVGLDELRARCPRVPTLAEVIAGFGRRVHLMVELKLEPYTEPERQNAILAEHFEPLTVRRNYHLLSLAPELFDVVTFAPRSACFPIAQTRVKAFSRLAGRGGFGGLFGHYLLLKDDIVKRHHVRNQKVGTGYVGSRNCLFRELQRGVDFIFSNSAARMQKLIDEIIRRG